MQVPVSALQSSSPVLTETPPQLTSSWSVAVLHKQLIIATNISGRNRNHFHSNLHNRMCDENYCLRVLPSSNSLSEEHVEHSRLHNCNDWVSSANITTKSVNFHVFDSNLFVTVLTLHSDFYYPRLFSSLLAVMQIEGVNVKSLRAFRVLRPLRLLSSIPSKQASQSVVNTKFVYRVTTISLEPTALCLFAVVLLVDHLVTLYVMVGFINLSAL